MQLFGGSSERKSCRQTLLVTRHCPLEMRNRTSWSIDQFVVAKKLGGGYASTVHLAVCKASGIQVAVKIYHRVKLSQLNQYQVKREVRIHSCLDHPNVLKLYAAFEDEAGVYLITEFASRGDVFGELDRRGGTMSEGDAVRQVLQPFMSALRYLHALNIIHRDIKPENLLMTAAGELKVADFGLSIDITQERPVTRVGTLDYMAPEVVVCPDKCLPSDNKEKTHLHYTHLVDAWAVGVLAYELTVGRAPFDAGNKRATIDQILNGAPTYPSWISEQARHFITWSLTKDVKTRPDVHQLAYHPWITQHAPKPRPRISPNRAASAADLLSAPGCGERAHMEARHKALAAGQLGGAPSAAAAAGEESSDPGVATDDSDGAAGVEAEVLVQGAAGAGGAAAGGKPPKQAAAGAAAPEGGAAGAGAGGAGGAPSGAGAAPRALPPPAGGAGGRGASGSPPAAAQPASPFASRAQQAAPQQAAPAARGLFESAAEGLRAYVHRCQSANNLDSLRAAVLMQQPAEPSHACFEPGGRFYSPKASAPAASAPAAAAGAQPQPQAGQQQQQPARPSPHDSVGSVGGGGSPKPSSGAPLPPSGRPPALQLVRLPAPGAAAGAAGAGAGAARPGAAALAPAPVSPACSLSPMATTPESRPAPRVQLFAKPAAPAPAPRGAGSSGASGVDCMQVDSAASAAGCDGASSCGSAAEFVSVCSNGGAQTPGSGGDATPLARARRGAALLPPEPMSPPRAGAAKAAAAAAALGAAAACAGECGACGAGRAAGAPAVAGACAGAGDGSQQPGWFGLQCVNFLRPNKA